MAISQSVDINSIYSFLKSPYAHILIIFSAYLLTWAKSLYGQPLIDDDMGIFPFSEHFNAKEDKLVDSYKEGDKEYKFLSYLPHLGFPGSFMRWHRLQVGKAYKVVGKNKKGHEIYGWVQSPFRHHLWSMFVYGVALLLCYNFLSYNFGPQIAFPATLLFAIHPVANQAICWISCINYSYCLVFLLANYTVLQLNLNYYWTIPLTIVFTFLSSLSLLVGCFNFAILWLLGFHWEAFAAFLVGLLIMLRDGKTVVNYRRQEFKKQDMTASISPNIRKPIIMLKTLWYYICLVVYPKSLGLYHSFGYHYSRKDEEPSAMFWLGLLSASLMAYGLWKGDFLIQFCIVWFLSFFLIFSNFITANQFVVERYIFIPSLAFCVIFAHLIYPYPNLFWLLIGLYAMRSHLHVWTFKDHISFYTSNVMNFPKSEVAYGNLGCAYQGVGKSGTAFDMWAEATKINPHYDVPWYNMHSLVKTAGDLVQSRNYLQKCMDAKVVHFKETWDKEMAALNNAIIKKELFDNLSKELNNCISTGSHGLIEEIKKKMDILMDPKTVVQMDPSPAKAPS